VPTRRAKKRQQQQHQHQHVLKYKKKQEQKHKHVSKQNHKPTNEHTMVTSTILMSYHQQQGCGIMCINWCLSTPL
jgi:predicted transcriptional regulator YheO